MTAAAHVLLALLSACLGLLAALLVLTLGVRLAYAGRALPGVTVAGVSLAGRNQADIETLLTQTLTYPQSGLIVLRDGDRLWPARPFDLGVLMDTSTMARRALAVGREGDLLERLRGQWDAWRRGVAVAPVVIFNERVADAYLQIVALQIDRPEVEASLSINGLEIEALAGQIGRRLDTPATLRALEPVIARLYDADVGLVIQETLPLVLDTSAQAEIARTILGQPLVLTADGAGPWTLDPPALASMLRFNRITDQSGAHYQVGLDPDQLAAYLEPLAPGLERRPENARFIFNDDTRQLDLLREAVIGRSLDAPATIRAANDGLNAGQHQIALVFQTSDPAVGSDATGAELGITENVVAVSTYFAGSSPARIQNIRTASAAFHGMLVAPGETLSMAEALGDISLETGYAEALIIYNGRTVNGLGGGVCQVSTTFFRAAFYGGYQIDERHPHAYLVGYYQQGPNSPGPGLDATVFAPLVDFRFTNDSPYWLLMETYIYGNQLLWKFYSTSDGRHVDWTSSGPTNVVDHPEALYRENADLPSGEIKQVDYAADGMDVTVTRTVTRDGQVIHSDTFRTHYNPWRAIYEYGPGTPLPEGARTE